MIATLVFLVILNGHVQLQKQAFKSMEECNQAGPKVAEQLELDPAIDDILYGACIPEEGQAVKS